MLRLTPGVKVLIMALLLAGLPVVSQQNLPEGPKPKAQQAQQGVPDAPQPKQGQFPENAPPAPINAHPEQPEAAATPVPQPPAAAQKGVGGGREELYKMTVS